MELRIMRDGVLLFASSEIIEWSFDALAVSGVDYWAQEARQAKLVLLYTPLLQNLLEGPSREIAAGFHTLNFTVFHAGRLLFAGVLAEGEFSLAYLSLQSQKLELNLLDYLGLLIHLAADREHQVAASTHPVAILPAIIASCFTGQSDDELNTSQPASVIRLAQALGVISWQGAADSYQSGDWLPWRVQDYEIYNCSRDLIPGNQWNSFYIITLGLLYTDHGLVIYFSHHACYDDLENPASFWDGQEHSYIDVFVRKEYSLNMSRITPCSSFSFQSLDRANPISHIMYDPPADLFQLYYGDYDYRVSGQSILYSGLFTLDNVETVPGWYKCKDLLAEFLKISHAVLLNSSGQFTIRNRIDDLLPLALLSDPISASVDEAEPSAKPASSPVAVASLAILEAIDRYYGYYLAARGLVHEAEIVLLDAQLPSLLCPSGATPPLNPYDLINYRIAFDNRTFYPKEIDYDIATGEITYRGWC